jgi:cytochrome o ubiquinol oxidase subunit II
LQSAVRGGNCAFSVILGTFDRDPAVDMRKALLRGTLSVFLRASLIAGGALMLADCSGGVLDAQGPVGAADTKIMLNALGIMLVIVVPTILAVLAVAWWFRASNTRASYQPDFVYSGRIEIIVWAIPLLVIMFLGGVIWIGAHELDPYEPLATQTKPAEVQVVSLDWKWLFIYPDDGIASVNELVIPVGTPVHFSLTSASVMNSFFVPQLGSMIATMNGMVTQLHLKADRPGVYFGESAQFSGDGFSGMTFNVRAVSQDNFSQWVTAARQSGPALDRDAYQALAQESQNVRPYTFRAVAPNLFDAIVKLELAPGPGPRAGDAGAQVRPVGAH